MVPLVVAISSLLSLASCDLLKSISIGKFPLVVEYVMVSSVEIVVFSPGFNTIFLEY